MRIEDRLFELVMDAEDRRRDGHDVCVEELCPESPELWPILRELIDGQTGVDQLLPPTAGGVDLTQTAGDDTESSAAAVLPEIPGYEVRREIGRGGMGVVYEAFEGALGRHVAIKFLPERGDLPRFRREAEAAGRLHHTNIVPVFGVGDHRGRHFYVMQFINGRGLDAVLEQRARDRGVSGSAVRPDFREVARIGAQLAEALAYAHEHGVLHRDIKPSNLLLDEHGTVWVTDFGLAKDADDAATLTHTGDLLGTLRYMAPERIKGRGDARADIYGLGVSLYELICGRPAFAQGDRAVLLHQLLHDDPPRPRSIEPRVPRDLETIVLKAMVREPDQRYETATAMGEDLRRFREDRPIRARRASAGERLARWCRRNPTVAVLLGAVASLLVILAFGSSIAALRLRRAAREADRARLGEIAARRRSELDLSDLQTSHGLLAAERDDPTQAMLWFAEAALSGHDDPWRAEANRIRVAAWGRRAIWPVHALEHSGQDLAALVFSADSRYLLTQTRGGRSFLWDLETGAMLPWARGDRPPGPACFSPDGSALALGTPAGTVEIRAVPSGGLLHRIDHEGAIHSLVFSPGGDLLGIASDSARVWSLSANRFVTPVFSHSAPVTALAFNRRGDRLATSCLDDRARLFAVPSADDNPNSLFAPVEHQGLYTGPDRCISIAPIFPADGDSLVTLAERLKLAWHRADSGALFRQLDLPGPMATAPSHDGKSLAVGGWQKAEVLELNSGRTLSSMKHPSYARAVAFSPDDHTLVTTGDDHMVRFWSLPEGRVSGARLMQQQIGEQVAWSPDGRSVATSQLGGMARVWRLPASDPSPRWVAPHDRGYIAARLSNDGRYLVDSRPITNFGMDGVRRARVFALADGRPIGAFIELDSGRSFRDVSLSPDGRALAAVSIKARASWPAPGGRLDFHDPRTGQRLSNPIDLPGEPGRVRYSPDGAIVAVICSSRDVLLINSGPGRIIRRLVHESEAPLEIVNLEFTPDGQTLITVGGRSAQVRNVATGELRYPALAHGDLLYRPAVSHDGRWLATGGRDGWLRVWDLADGRLASPPMRHPDWVFEPVFSHDDQHIAVACRDGTARVWDWRAGRLDCPPMKHDDEVFSVAFSPDDHLVLALTWRAGLRVWEWHTGRPLTPPIFPSADWAMNLVLSPNGHDLIVSTNRQFIAYNLDNLVDPGDLVASQLATAAEVVSGRRVDRGEVVGLSADEWIERWTAFRRAHPLVDPRVR